ncbi:MAG TPA: tetratricopeptide repeat protein [Burkholderiales bacterium]|nr:tetratricopeptide repeat protein [Burkholderiales bacterium]
MPASAPVSRHTFSGTTLAALVCMALAACAQTPPQTPAKADAPKAEAPKNAAAAAPTQQAQAQAQTQAPAAPKAGTSAGQPAAQAPSAPQVLRASPPAEPEPKLPNQELTDAILYEFLLAEIAGQRGNVGLAAQAYADLAKRTHDPRIARRAAEIALFARMNKAALESARIWYEADPGSSRARQALIGLLIAANQFEEVEPLLRNLLAAKDADTTALFAQLGRTLSGAADKAGALRLMQRLAADYPALPQAHVAVAQVAAASDENLALAEVRKARELRPDWESAALLEAQILQPRSNKQALDVLKDFLDRYPNSREVRINYARTLVAEKRLDEARVQFQSLVKIFPQDAEVVYAVALLSLQAKDYAQAEANLRRLLELDVRDKNQVRMYLGQVAEEQKHYADALQWYGQVDGGEQYLLARIRYANVLSQQGRVDAARAWLHDTEAKDNQSSVQLALAEAQILRDNNDVKGGFDLLGGMLERMPNNPELLYDYAMLAERLDRMDVLETNLKKLIELRPENAQAYNALGYSLADRNLRLPEARALIEKALKLAPDDAFIIDSMGWVLYRQGQVKEAIEYLQKAFAARPDAEIAAHLGEVLWSSGDRASAVRILREAKDKSPENETLQATLKRLNQ